MATTPRNIWTPDSGDGYNLTVDLAAMADTIDDALDDIDVTTDFATAEADIATLQSDMTTAQGDIDDLQAVTEIYHYRPADSAALAAITGMRIGDLAYQVDTDTLYRYSGSAWVAWESGWITWATAPTNITVGTGGSAEQTQKYRYVNGEIFVRFKYVLGTSGASVGTIPHLNLPFNIAPLSTRYSPVLGTVGLYDDNATVGARGNTLQEATSLTQIILQHDTGAVWQNITATVPWTWAANDIIAGEFWVTPA